MNVLVFDTETTGLPDWKRPTHAEGQPRICSISILMCNESGEIGADYTQLIKPDGWECTIESTALNKLTTEQCMDEGVPIIEALDAWDNAVQMADVVVGYNVEFDLKMMRGELRQDGRPDQKGEHTTSCAMQAARKHCDRGAIKLVEAYSHIFHEVMPGAHTANGDAEATRRIWFHLKALGAVVIKPPKNPPETQTNETPAATATPTTSANLQDSTEDDNAIF